MRNFFPTCFVRTFWLLWAAWITVVSISAIDFLPASGQNIASGFQNQRDRDFCYHTYKDDQHWYGTNLWAVRFDFSEEYPTYEQSTFEIHRVRIYFPVVTTPAYEATVRIHTTDPNIPDHAVAAVTSEVTSNWMEFTIPDLDTMSVAWIVLECNTNVDGPYISASRGGGGHSYYWNTNTPVQYFQNLYTAGIYSEFLFTVVGRFVLSDTDIELSSFDLLPEVSIGSRVTPQFSIYNNSSRTVNNAVVLVNLTGANPSYVIEDSILVTMSIPPQSELFVAYNDPDYLDHSYQLPEYASQIKVRAFLRTEFSEADTIFNNTVVHYYDLFERVLPVKIVENFLRYNDSLNQLVSQDSSSLQGFTALSYFPVAADPNYSIGATQRYNWYGLMGMPMTVIGGDSLIAGYITDDYQERFTNAVQSLSNQFTFIGQGEASVTLPSPYNYLSVRLTLRNNGTWVFDNGIDPSLVQNCRFFTALAHKVNLHNRVRYVFSRWGAYSDTLATTLSINDSWSKQISVPVNNITPTDLQNNYVLLYWIQHNTTKQIIYANLIPIENVVFGNDDALTPEPFSCKVYPNPIVSGSAMELKFSGNYTGSYAYQIYNCKGQLSGKGHILADKGLASIPAATYPASGIYYLRLKPVGKNFPADIGSLTLKFIYIR